MSGRWLTNKAAATLLGISPNTLREEVKSGRIGTVPVGSRRYIPMSEIERYEAESVARSRKRPMTAPSA